MAEPERNTVSSQPYGERDAGTFFEPTSATESDINNAGLWMVVGTVVSIIGLIVAIATDSAAGTAIGWVLCICGTFFCFMWLIRYQRLRRVFVLQQLAAAGVTAVPVSYVMQPATTMYAVPAHYPQQQQMYVQQGYPQPVYANTQNYPPQNLMQQQQQGYGGYGGQQQQNASPYPQQPQQQHYYAQQPPPAGPSYQ
jgi:hypothetical protein